MQREAIYSRPFDRDRLNLVARDDSMRVAMDLLDRIQKQDPELAMAGTAIMFAAFVRRLKLSPQDTYELGLKLLEPQQFHRKANIVGEVLRDFAGIRMAGDRNVEAA
jgi:hypothetical protein